VASLALFVDESKVIGTPRFRSTIKGAGDLMIIKSMSLVAMFLLLLSVSAKAEVNDFKIECDWSGGNPFEKGGRAVFEYRSSKEKASFLVDHGFFEYPADGVVRYEVNGLHVDRYKYLNVYYSRTFMNDSGFGKETRMFRLIYSMNERKMTVRGASLTQSKDRLIVAQEHGSDFNPSESTTQYRNCISLGL